MLLWHTHIYITYIFGCASVCSGKFGKQWYDDSQWCSDNGHWWACVGKGAVMDDNRAMVEWLEGTMM